MVKKEIKLRVSEGLYNQIKKESIRSHRSSNCLLTNIIVNHLNQNISKKQSITSSTSQEKKPIRSTIRLTKLEAEILDQYAQRNGWKITEEIRYRLIGSITNSGKINGEEMSEIREIRNNINALGRNVNRIIREDKIVDSDGKTICAKLVEQIHIVGSKIEKIVHDSKSRFIITKD